MSVMFLELSDEKDNITIRTQQPYGENNELRDMDITIFGNGEMAFSFPVDDPNTGKVREVQTVTNAHEIWLNGTPK